MVRLFRRAVLFHVPRCPPLEASCCGPPTAGNPQFPGSDTMTPASEVSVKAVANEKHNCQVEYLMRDISGSSLCEYEYPDVTRDADQIMIAFDGARSGSTRGQRTQSSRCLVSSSDTNTTSPNAQTHHQRTARAPRRSTRSWTSRSPRRTAAVSSGRSRDSRRSSLRFARARRTSSPTPHEHDIHTLRVARRHFLASDLTECRHRAFPCLLRQCRGSIPGWPIGIPSSKAPHSRDGTRAWKSAPFFVDWFIFRGQRRSPKCSGWWIGSTGSADNVGNFVLSSISAIVCEFGNRGAGTMFDGARTSRSGCRNLRGCASPVKGEHCCGRVMCRINPLLGSGR